MSSGATETRLGGLDLVPTAAMEDLEVFHRSLAALCRSELPLPRAFELLAADLGKGPLRDAVERMGADVRDGVPLPEAYARHESAFPPLYRALVESGVRTGDLAGALEEIAAHVAVRAEVCHRLDRATARPLLTLAFVVVVGTALLVGLAPEFSTFASGYRTQAGIHAAAPDFLDAHFLSAAALALLAVTGIAVFATTRWRRPVDGVAAGRTAAFRMPLLGPIRLYAASAEFCATLALLVRRRMPLDQALELTAAATSHRGFAAHVRRMADSAAQGAGLAESISDGGVLAPSLQWLLENAEERGHGEDALLDIARIYRRRLERAVDRLTLLVGPAIELAVGVAVFLLALDFVFPFAEIVSMTRVFSAR